MGAVLGTTTGGRDIARGREIMETADTEETAEFRIH